MKISRHQLAGLQQRFLYLPYSSSSLQSFFKDALRQVMGAMDAVKSLLAYVKARISYPVSALMNKTDSWIHGEVRKPTDQFRPGVTTVKPKNPIKKEEWLQNYRVSYMYGWRSTPVYLENCQDTLTASSEKKQIDETGNNRIRTGLQQRKLQHR